MEIAMPESTSTGNRLSWVDNAKGIGILLVLLGHTPIPLMYKLFIYAFHMPLFFFLGGLFLKMDKSPTAFVKDKMQRLLLPYVGFAVLSYAIWLGIRNYSTMAGSIPVETPLLGIFYGVGSGNWMPENTPLWFLPCLFATICLLYLLVRLPFKLALLAILACSVVGYNLSHWINFRLPLSFDLAMMCVVFVGLGYYYRKYWLSAPPLPWPQTVGCIAIWLLAAWFNTGILNPVQMIDINNSAFSNYFLFLIAAIGGTVVIVNLAKRLMHLPVLAYLGKNSIAIFCLHMLIYFAISIIFKKLLHFPIALTYEHLSMINPHANPAMVVILYLIPGILVPLSAMRLYQACKTSWIEKWKTQKVQEPSPLFKTSTENGI